MDAETEEGGAAARRHDAGGADVCVRTVSLPGRGGPFRRPRRALKREKKSVAVRQDSSRRNPRALVEKKNKTKEERSPTSPVPYLVASHFANLSTRPLPPINEPFNFFLLTFLICFFTGVKNEYL